MALTSAYNPLQHEEEENIFHHHILGGGDKKHNMQKEEGFEKNETGKRFFIHKKMEGFAH